MRQFLIFITIGVINTALYLVLFNVFRLSMGPFAANGAAVALSISFSYWANSRFTFRVSGTGRRVRRFAEFAAVFVVTLLVSNAALWALFQIVDDPSAVQESTALVVAGGGLVVVRFVIMRGWVFDPARAG